MHQVYYANLKVITQYIWEMRPSNVIRTLFRYFGVVRMGRLYLFVFCGARESDQYTTSKLQDIKKLVIMSTLLLPTFGALLIL